MTTTGSDQCISKNSANGAPVWPRSDASAGKNDSIVNARVTYAPLAVWKDFHWTCTVTNFSSPVHD
jgi:hypothetical protein